MESIKFAKVKENAIIPTKDIGNAGYDVYGIFEENNDKNRIIHPFETKLIPTGLACALPDNYYFQVEERGSTGSKGIKKSAGVIDSSFRGEIFIAITNSTPHFIVFGDKESYIAEARAEFEQWQLIDENNLSDADKQSLNEVLNEKLGKEFVEGLSQETKEMAYQDIIKTVKSDAGILEFESNLEEAIFYPDTKAIAQIVLHKVPELPVEEISYEELKNIPSTRGEGMLGSSGK